MPIGKFKCPTCQAGSVRETGCYKHYRQNMKTVAEVPIPSSISGPAPVITAPIVTIPAPIIPEPAPIVVELIPPPKPTEDPDKMEKLIKLAEPRLKLSSISILRKNNIPAIMSESESSESESSEDESEFGSSESESGSEEGSEDDI